jgi:peroxiredoxin Q/BCP
MKEAPGALPITAKSLIFQLPSRLGPLISRRLHMRTTRILLSALMVGVAAPVAAQSAPAAMATAAAAVAKPLEVGTVAPDFTLPGATRFGVLQNPIHLSDFKGKTVVVAFFPKARTKGCTIQMHAYRDQYNELLNGGRDVVLIAVSADSATTLASWAHDDEFPFLMASDLGLNIAKMYGAVGTATAKVASRNLFVVGPDGKIVYRATPFREIDPTAYTDLGTQLKKLIPKDTASM